MSLRIYQDVTLAANDTDYIIFTTHRKLTVKSFIFVGPDFRGFMKMGTFVGM